MNWLLVGGLGLPGTAMLGPFAYFFKPNMCASRSGRQCQCRQSRATTGSLLAAVLSSAENVSRWAQW